MKLKDRFTEEQRQTKFYKFIRGYYYVGGCSYLILGIVLMVVMDYMIIRGQPWKSSESYALGLILFIIPFIPLSGGIYIIRGIFNMIKEADWDYIRRVEEEAPKEINPWDRRDYIIKTKKE